MQDRDSDVYDEVSDIRLHSLPMHSAKTKTSNMPYDAPPDIVCAAFLVESLVTARCGVAASNDGHVNLQPEHS